MINKYLSDCPQFLNQKLQEPIGTFIAPHNEKEKILNEVLSGAKNPIISKSTINNSITIQNTPYEKISEEKIKKKILLETENVERETEKEKKGQFHKN